MDGDGRSAQRFGFESTTDDVLAGVDLGGRTMLVTGASTGLGEETTRALATHGATITHHHAVGRDHDPWYRQQRPDPVGVALAAAKDALDPSGVLNPGVIT